MEPNSLKYQESIALEFEANKNRVRYLIGSSHWGEDGRHKEVFLMNFLKRILPNYCEVGTGFLKEGENISTQIDIIIYDPSFPNYYIENDFVIVQPKSVLGIIEVKSNPRNREIGEAIAKANKIGEFIQDNSIFNGLFIYGEEINNGDDFSKSLTKPTRKSLFKESLQEALVINGGINHIVSLDGGFIKKWDVPKKFSCYNIKKLSISYFFSNLLDIINKNNSLIHMPESMYDHLFSISEGKEAYRNWEIYPDN